MSDNMGAQMQGRAKHDEVWIIHNLTQIQKLIKDTPGVVVSFGRTQPVCPACEHFKPKFLTYCHGNTNKKIVFCQVDCSSVQRDVPDTFNI